MKRSLIKSIAVVTAFGLVAAACGGDDDDSSKAAGPKVDSSELFLLSLSPTIFLSSVVSIPSVLSLSLSLSLSLISKGAGSPPRTHAIPSF